MTENTSIRVAEIQQSVNSSFRYSLSREYADKAADRVKNQVAAMLSEDHSDYDDGSLSGPEYQAASEREIARRRSDEVPACVGCGNDCVAGFGDAGVHFVDHKGPYCKSCAINLRLGNPPLSCSMCGTVVGGALKYRSVKNLRVCTDCDEEAKKVVAWLNTPDLTCDMCKEVIPAKKEVGGFVRHDCSVMPADDFRNLPDAEVDRLVKIADEKLNKTMQGHALSRAIGNTKDEPVIMGRWDR